MRLPPVDVPLSMTSLPRRAPDALEEAILLGEAVEAVVRLAHGTDETAHGVGLVLAGVATVLVTAPLSIHLPKLQPVRLYVHLGDADLNGGVVLGLDDAVGGRALPGDVARWGILC